MMKFFFNDNGEHIVFGDDTDEFGRHTEYSYIYLLDSTPSTCGARAGARSLQIPSSTSLPLVKFGQNRYEPPASMFAKSQTDWPFGWSAKQAKRSNHDPA